jgi:DNA-binding CsgD family transcriptional regulator
MRPIGMGTFDAAEVKAFEQLSRHMTRALQMAVRLERLETAPAGIAALDALPHALALVDAKRRLVHANDPMEALLRQGRGLTLLDGFVVAKEPAAQARLVASVREVIDMDAELAPPAPFCLDEGSPERLALHVLPVAGRLGHYLPPTRVALLMVARTEAARAPTAESLVERYGCTPAEARLAVHLAAGERLRTAATAMGITYGTARIYLKTVFDKVGVHSQGQLVARLIGSPGSGSAD